jgi:hypothetical protein
MPKKSAKKHPRHMTTEDAAKHLFHPKLVTHLKKQIQEPKPRKKSG